jgi:D-3-phosphoglycerate dehydrogenase / 2-oxoglutarate reductase
MSGRVVFIDCNDQLAPVLGAVMEPGDPPIDVNQAPFVSEDLPRLLEGCATCIVDHSYMPTDIVARCAELRDIVFLGTGPQSYMDVEALRRRGVTVHAIKGYGDIAVAEHTIALMFACARDLTRMDREIRAGHWVPREGTQLIGKRFGILGLGGIGREAARIARGVGMEVMAWNRTPRPDATASSIDAVLRNCDVVSLHLALNEETKGLLDGARLASMKRGAMLLNTARGALIDEAALIEALDRDHIACAGLDVFALEPLRLEHPLAKHERVTLSAHSGFRTYEASATLLRRALDIVRRLAAQ